MTNPNNAVGTNAAYGGRTSVNAFNDWANFYSRGIVSGWVAAPASGMTIQLGGLAGIRDVALAEDPNGNKVSISNRTTSPISVEIAAASTTATRHDLIVAYVNSPAQVSATTLDNPSACGIIAVQGSQSSLPNDTAIRAAITSDGGTGTTAYYVALAEVSVPANTTTITSGLISQTDFNAQVNSAGILPPESITADKIDFATFTNQSLSDIFANLQVASTTFKLPYNDSASSKLYRVGPFVFANIDASFTFSNPAGGAANETIPSGYRPRWTAVTLIKSPISNDTPGMSLSFGADGNISYWSSGSANNTRFYGFCAWLTDDPWPV